MDDQIEELRKKWKEQIERPLAKPILIRKEFLMEIVIFGKYVLTEK